MPVNTFGGSTFGSSQGSGFLCGEGAARARRIASASARFVMMRAVYLSVATSAVRPPHTQHVRDRPLLRVAVVLAEAGLEAAAEIEIEVADVNRQARLGTAFEVHGARDVQRQGEKQVVEVAHRIRRPRKEEEEASAAVERERSFAPAPRTRRPDVLPVRGDQAEVLDDRSEERRVGKECRYRWTACR